MNKFQFDNVKTKFAIVLNRIKKDVRLSTNLSKEHMHYCTIELKIINK